MAQSVDPTQPREACRFIGTSIPARVMRPRFTDSIRRFMLCGSPRLAIELLCGALYFHPDYVNRPRTHDCKRPVHHAAWRRGAAGPITAGAALEPSLRRLSVEGGCCPPPAEFKSVRVEA